ncbi:MAG: glycosyltransferase family 4 protein [Bacteroidia bacterium]|nr:glycosyltransferase family 4 protein [Sphingobacteriaceae bacterium]MBP9068262.1 glycosyltransferase family 4 protein [Bacteroidia bacterium]
MQKHSYYLCKYFATNQIHVDLIHFNKSEHDISKLEFFSEKEREYIHPTIIEIPTSIGFPGHYIYNSYRHSKLIFEFLKPKLDQYDLIYTKGFTGWYLINQKHKDRINCSKIGVKFHGYEMFQPLPGFVSGIKSLLLRGPVKKISQRADIVFSYGGKITDIIRSIGVKNSNIIECASGIEEEFIVEKFKPTDTIKRFLYLGRYERRKGIEELSSALQQLISKHTNEFQFHFIGAIPQDKRIDHKNIIYHGEIRDRIILLEKMQGCDVLICPSFSEGFPNVILEAMSNGLAVAATNVGAVELLVNEEVGWIIEKPEADSIKQTLEMIISENALSIDQKKQKAISKIKDGFVWNKLIKKLIKSIAP